MWARSSVAALALGLAAFGGPPTGTARGPMAVYDQACVRCHGPEGSFYGPEFGKGLGDAALRRAVADMADGKGDVRLSPAELEAQTAYHRAIIRHEPFVAITLRTPDRLAGEATEGASVSVWVDGKPVMVRRDGFRWEASARGTRREVRAVRGDRQTRIDADRQWHSHPAPTEAKKDTGGSG